LLIYILQRNFIKTFNFIECRETISALDEREKMLRSWLMAAGSKGGIVGGQDSEESEEVDPLYGAYAGEEIREFVTEEQYLADKGIQSDTPWKL
jgi:hypothetical protein